MLKTKLLKQRQMNIKIFYRDSKIVAKTNICQLFLTASCFLLNYIFIHSISIFTMDYIMIYHWVPIPLRSSHVKYDIPGNYIPLSWRTNKISLTGLVSFNNTTVRVGSFSNFGTVENILKILNKFYKVWINTNHIIL